MDYVKQAEWFYRIEMRPQLLQLFWRNLQGWFSGNQTMTESSLLGDPLTNWLAVITAVFKLVWGCSVTIPGCYGFQGWVIQSHCFKNVLVKMHNRASAISVSKAVIDVCWWCLEFPGLMLFEPRVHTQTHTLHPPFLVPLFRFTKNLSPDKINLSTLKGEGQLSNLELDEEVLQNMLDLPTWLAVTRVYCNKAAIRVCCWLIKPDLFSWSDRCSCLPFLLRRPLRYRKYYKTI